MITRRTHHAAIRPHRITAIIAIILHRIVPCQAGETSVGDLP